MGNAFPSRLLRAPLPLRAGGVPQRPSLSDLPQFAQSSIQLTSRFQWCISERCLPSAGSAFLAAQAAFTHARDTSPTASGPSGIDSCVVRMTDQPLPQPPLAASPSMKSVPAPPRLSTRAGTDFIIGHAG